jgi:hypothetical protein
MAKKSFFAGMVAMVLAFGMMVVGCDDGSDDDSGGGGGNSLTYSIQVNNQAAVQSSQQLSVARSEAAEDIVELYILHFVYCEDAKNRGMILVANGDMVSPSGVIDNAGWYSVNENLAVTNTVNNGPYSGFQIKISKLRVGGEEGTEYIFPEEGVLFGNPTSIWVFGQDLIYQDNFPGITITDSTVSLKTVLTVNPDIIGENEGYDEYGLATDPYQYIMVEGKVNE